MMRRVVKEYNKKVSLSQNESRDDYVPSRHQQLFYWNCCACNNFWHMARNYKLMVPIRKGNENDATKYQGNEERKVWKNKDDVECSIALCTT